MLYIIFYTTYNTYITYITYTTYTTYITYTTYNSYSCRLRHYTVTRVTPLQGLQSYRVTELQGCNYL